MKEYILDRLKREFPHHALPLLSSFIYILVAIGLYSKDKLAFAFLFLVFITSLFYHSHPENMFFRIGDWLASITFITYIIRVVYLCRYPLNALVVLGFFCIIIWIISEISDKYKFNKIYNISHTLWHLLSALTVFMVIFSVY